MVGRLIDVFTSANEVPAISAKEGELATTSIRISGQERRRTPGTAETSERLITRIAPRTLPIAAGTLSHILSRPFFSICAIHPRRICMNRRFEACSAKLLVFLRNRLEKPYGFFLQLPTFPPISA
ncbi:hypothetical protein V1478_005467, partial [Vespula squamosa]